MGFIFDAGTAILRRRWPMQAALPASRVESGRRYVSRRPAAATILPWASHLFYFRSQRDKFAASFTFTVDEMANMRTYHHF